MPTDDQHVAVDGRIAGRLGPDAGDVGTTEIERDTDARATLLGGGGLDGQAVDEVVHRIARVALHPAEGDVAALAHELDERLPQVAVGHRLALAS